jgi:hypothetical protein
VFDNLNFIRLKTCILDLDGPVLDAVCDLQTRDPSVPCTLDVLSVIIKDQVLPDNGGPYGRFATRIERDNMAHGQPINEAPEPQKHTFVFLT